MQFQVEGMRTRRNWRRLFLWGVLGTVLALALFLLGYSYFFGPMDKTASRQDVIVNPDDSVGEVAKVLREQGYIRSEWAFRVAYVRAGGNLDGVLEGGYEISASMDAWTIGETLASPPHLAWITFPAGWRKEQIADLLAKKLNWNAEQKQRWLLVDTAPTPDLIEGVYYGDTYLIPIDQEPAQVAARLRGRFEDATKELAEEARREGKDWQEILTMASLIEREAAKDDKALISGILWNRIEADMGLQVDATLQYVRGSYEEETSWWPAARAEDKGLDSLFNTYKYRGLPPHPIATPSLESIEAALNPQTTSCIYYLHDGDGQIHCSPTYKGHLANVNKYLK